MIVGMSDVQLVLMWLGMLLAAIFAAVVFFVVLYFVVRKAVFDALRKHDALVVSPQRPL